jgi:cysteine desulfurase
MNRIYLDHNATTPLHPEVREAMLPYLSQFYGNASSLHDYGREARNAVETARDQVATLIGAKDPSEIVFTSGGTEADNYAIKGVAFNHLGKKANHIITSRIEHHAVLHSCEYLETIGFEVTYLDVDRYGWVDPEAIRQAIKDTTCLITLMYANNEIGTVEPIERVAPIVMERGIVFHTDAVQTAGKIPIDVEELSVSLLSLSSHKVYGPKGIGALYVRHGTELEKWIHGGAQEGDRRAGTENVPAIVGFGKAAEIALKQMDREGEQIRALTNKLRCGLHRQLDLIYENTPPEEARRLPGTLNISFDYVDGESLILGLNMQGICVSSGSACNSGTSEPSHVLRALGLPAQLAMGSVRFSLGRDNTDAEIDHVLEVVPHLVNRIRFASAAYRRTQGEITGSPQ